MELVTGGSFSEFVTFNGRFTTFRVRFVTFNG